MDAIFFFFVVVQMPTGYFVLNDVFRFVSSNAQETPVSVANFAMPVHGMFSFQMRQKKKRNATSTLKKILQRRLRKSFA